MQTTLNQQISLYRDTSSSQDGSISFWLINGIQDNINWFRAGRKLSPSLMTHIQSLLLFPLFFVIRLYLNWILKKAKKKFVVRDYDEILKDPKVFKILMKDYNLFKKSTNLELDESIAGKNIRHYIPIGARVVIAPLEELNVVMSAYINCLKNSFDKLDRTPKDDFFQHLDNDTLWNDRIKAYDYVA